MANDIETRKALLVMATRKHGETILPVDRFKTVDQGFVQYDEELTLWYNTPDGSTHMVTSRKLEVAHV